MQIIFSAATLLFHSGVSAQGGVVGKNEKGAFAIVAWEAATIYRGKNNIGRDGDEIINKPNPINF